MKRGIVAWLLLGVFVSLGAGRLCAETAEEALKKTFPKLHYESIVESAMTGIFEVTAGDNIIYFEPKSGSLLFGEVITKEGKNVTAAKRAEMMTKKVKELKMDTAIKVGSGKNAVIEFTDPDCQYCRKAFEFLEKRTDVTKYVFLFPLPMHPQAEDKARYILCAKDKAKAYTDVMSGKLDNVKVEVCNSLQVEEVLKAHKAIGEGIGVAGTPFFVVNGEVVKGANIPQIEQLLGGK